MARRLPPWSWHGLAGVILAASVGVSYGATLVIVALAPTPVTDRGAEILTNLGSVLVGAVATWLGSHIGQAGPQDQEPDTAPYVEANDPRYTSSSSESNAQTDTSEAAMPAEASNPDEMEGS